MGRRSKLTPGQWEEVSRRLLAGEKARALAKEYGVAESTIRERFSDVHSEIKDVANQIVSADRSLKALPISAQIAAISLAEELKAISTHLASAAKMGAATAHRLASLANSEVQKIDDAEPLRSIENLKGVSVLTKLANESADIGINLLKANKDMIDDMNKNESEPEPKQIVFQVVDASA